MPVHRQPTTQPRQAPGQPRASPLGRARRPEPAPEAAPEAAPAPEAAAAPAGGLRFTSVDPQTKKLKVVCGAVEGTGGASADVAAASAESCTVEAILHDRSRRKAKVEGLTAGAYRCFDGAEDRCVRE